MEWNYQREESTFEEIPVGEHRVRIADAEKEISKNGNDMLVLTLDVSGYKSRLWHYVVFMPDHPEITNRNLTAIFDHMALEREHELERRLAEATKAMYVYERALYYATLNGETADEVKYNDALKRAQKDFAKNKGD